jgi:hypothetical protein
MQAAGIPSTIRTRTLGRTTVKTSWIARKSRNTTEIGNIKAIAAFSLSISEDLAHAAGILLGHRIDR